MNNELSPQVPIESQILQIPSFFKSLCQSGSRSSSENSTASEMASVIEVQTNREKITSVQSTMKCNCSRVLISDDDPFQEFYYQVLFDKIIESQDLPMTKAGLRLSVSRSGEELLEKYSVIEKCNCGSCLLVITDYNMGTEKLSGVDTAISLRKMGYKGPIILRTSEKEEDLCKEDSKLKELLERKIIDDFQEKNNHKVTKECIYKFLKRVNCPGKNDHVNSFQREY